MRAYRRVFSAEYAAPMNMVFAALLAALAADRWLTAMQTDNGTPRAGQRYTRRRERSVRFGRVLEVRPPLGITLRESVVIGSCRLDQHLRCMLVPRQEGTAVVLGVRYRPDGLARLRSDSWHRWLLREHKTTLVRLAEGLAGQDQGTAVRGQSQGSTSMTVAKITRVRGKPIFK